MPVVPKRLPHQERPAILRVDLRLSDEHSHLREWCFQRPYYAVKTLRNALETYLALEGGEALDRVLFEIADAPIGSRIRIVIDKSAQEPPRSESPAAASPVERQLSPAGPAPLPPEPVVEPSPPPIATPPELTAAPATATTAPDPPSPQIQAEAAQGPQDPPAPPASRQSTAEGQGPGTPDPKLVRDLTDIGERALRDVRARNASALLQNDAMFGGSAKPSPKPE